MFGGKKSLVQLDIERGRGNSCGLPTPPTQTGRGSGVGFKHSPSFLFPPFCGRHNLRISRTIGAMTHSGERPLLPPATLAAVHQHPTDLVLAVLDAPPPIPITVLATGNLMAGRYRFTFHIIGESHWVQAEIHGRPVLAEVLACVPISPVVCRDYHPFTDLAPYRVELAPYQAAVRFETLPAEGLAEGAPPQLEVRFPPMYGHTPLTRLWWGQRGETLWWRTLHLYPEPEKVIAVWSESTFGVSSEL